MTTHHADEDALNYIAKLESENAALKQEKDALDLLLKMRPGPYADINDLIAERDALKQQIAKVLVQKPIAWLPYC